MKNLVNFFNEIGKLKNMPRRRWVIRDIKNPESIAGHTFRAAIMAWFLGAEKNDNFNIEKIIKMALIHDLCDIYTGGITPYDSILPKNGKKRKELMKTWPRFTKAQKLKISREKHKKEEKGLNKLIKDLPTGIKKEIKNLWIDYEKGLSKEGRFFNQIDRIESFLQATEYWEKNKNLPQKPWWDQAREIFDDSVVLDFIESMNKKFHKKIKPRI